MFGNGTGMPNMNMGGMMGMQNNCMPGMMNMNMQNMNMQNMNIPNMNMQNMNIPNMNMQNMNMQNYGLMMGIPNMNMAGMNIGGNEEWTKGYNISNQNGGNNILSTKNKINFMFKTTQGIIRNINADYGTTISELIKKYFNIMGKPELFNNPQDICFLCNAKRLNFNDNTKIEIFFKNTSMVNIVVNDVKELIGAKTKFFY